MSSNLWPHGRVLTDLPVPVVLASSSPTRAELLARLVPDFETLSPAVDEEGVAVDDPRERALRLAEAKARDVTRRRPDALVIAADTLVACCGRTIGKPADREDAVRILEELTRHLHSVITAVWLVAPDGRERSCCVGADVRMRPMTGAEIEDYLEGFDALDKAGAYALQPNDPHVEELRGSITAVMGLPLDELRDMMGDLYPECGEGE